MAHNTEEIDFDFPFDFYDGFVCNVCHQIHEACTCGSSIDDMLDEQFDVLTEMENDKNRNIDNRTVDQIRMDETAEEMDEYFSTLDTIESPEMIAEEELRERTERLFNGRNRIKF